MLEFIMFFLFVVFIILIILLYKKYIKIKNVVDTEQDKKYKAIKNQIGSNNEVVKEMNEDVEDITGVTLSNLQNVVDTNEKQIKDNNQFITVNGIQNLNDIFEYNHDNGVFKIGGSSVPNISIDNNLQLNIDNPVQAKVCSSDEDCNNNIITLLNVDNEWPVQE